MPRIHVVHIIPTLAYGGAERSVVDVVNRGDYHNVRYSIFILKDIAPMATQILPGAAEVKLVPKRGKLSIGLFFALRAALKNAKPDVVHTHLFGGDVWGRLAARSLGIPVVTTEHNIDVDLGRVRRFVKRLLNGFSQEYVACSEAVKQFAVATYRVPKERVRVVRYGVPIAEYAPAAPLFPQPSARFLVLGRLVPQKGIDILFRALSEVPKHIDWTLDVIGDGEDRPALQEEMQMLGLSGRVQFHHATRDVSRVLANHDVVVVPSRWEGLGIVAMEAMAAGRVVIASRVGGLLECVRDKETGYFVPPENETVLAEMLEYVCTHKTEATQTAHRAQEYARTHFDAARMVADYEALYRRVVL